MLIEPKHFTASLEFIDLYYARYWLEISELVSIMT